MARKRARPTSERRAARGNSTPPAEERGSLNPRPDRVADPLFAASDFFDARDVVQVKYEMVRRVRVEGQPVRHSATAFGFSRPSFYQAQARLARGGLAALIPNKPGPRRSHKLDSEVVHFLQQLRSDDAAVRSTELARRVRQRFGRTVHPRSVERALARQKKNGRDHPTTPPRVPRPRSSPTSSFTAPRWQTHPAAEGSAGSCSSAKGWRAGSIAAPRAARRPSPAAAGDHVVAGLPIPPLHVGIVHVLASIALSRREAMSP
jgi:transposase